MLTLQHYPDAINQIGLSTLNEAQRRAHELIVKGSANFTNFAQLETLMAKNATIAEAVNKWIGRVDELLDKAIRAASVPTPPKSDRKTPLPTQTPVSSKPTPRNQSGKKTAAPASTASYSLTNRGNVAVKLSTGESFEFATSADGGIYSVGFPGVETFAFFTRKGNTKADKLWALYGEEATRFLRQAAKKPTQPGPAEFNSSWQPNDYLSIVKRDLGLDKVGIVRSVTPMPAYAIVEYATAAGTIERFIDKPGTDSDRDFKKLLKSQYESIVKEAKAKAGKRPASAAKPASVPPKKPVVATPTKAKSTKPSKSTPTPKAARLTTSDEQYFAADHVRALSPALKQLRTYVMLSRVGTKDKVRSALVSLQRAVTTQQIRKTDPLAGEIRMIQDEYIALLNGKKAPYRPTKDVDRLQGIVAKTKVYASVAILQTVLGWTLKDVTKAQAEVLLARIRTAKAKKKLTRSDPYYGRVLGLEQSLSAISAEGVVPQPYDLSGLQGVAAGRSAVQAAPGAVAGAVAEIGNLPTSVPALPANGPVVATVPPMMSAAQMMRYTYETYEFDREWRELLGRPAKNFKLLVWGKGGQGKSTLVLKFVRYLASRYAPVLYCSSEEYPSHTLNEKVDFVGGIVPGWDFAASPRELRPHHKIIVIDSVNNMGFTLAELKALATARPDLAIILIMQATKAGNFKGDQTWEHDVDTVVHAYAPGQARTTKNRFAALSDIKTF